VAAREGTEGQCLSDTGFDEVRRAHEALAAERVDVCPCFLFGRNPVLLGMDRLQHVADPADLDRRYVAEDVAVEMHGAAPLSGLGQVFCALSTRPWRASDTISSTPFSPRSTRWRRNADQPDLTFLAPSQMPRISR
jgi:hypothetical protein